MANQYNTEAEQWEKLADCPLGTENFGDSGYIYQDGRVWVAVVICEDGDEMDTPCDTRAEARRVVEQGA